MMWLFLGLTFLFGLIGYWGMKEGTDSSEMVGALSFSLSVASFGLMFVFAIARVAL